MNISPVMAWILATLVISQSCRISKLSLGAYKKIIKRPKPLSFASSVTYRKMTLPVIHLPLKSINRWPLLRGQRRVVTNRRDR